MKEIHVCACVIRRGEEVLICGRKKGSALEGFFEFPGGKLEKGELLHEAAKRELAEELGIKVFTLDEIGSARAESGEKCFHLHFLRAVIRPGEPEPEPREGQPMHWTATADLDRVRMLPGDVGFARLLAAAEKNGKKPVSGQ